MTANVASLWRYPVKGFTPERLPSVALSTGGFFPGDRLYAVEDGPSGFDPAAPVWLNKQKFTVLAKIARVARIRTRYDEASGVLEASGDGAPSISAPLTTAAGRGDFAAWLTEALGPEACGPLKVVHAPGHRFTDHPRGHVSIVNLASVRDLEARTGRAIDPLRFRANLYVEGWPAWIETQMVGADLRLGEASARVISQIVRCAATHVDPGTGVSDFDVVAALHGQYGHVNCGIYVSISEGGAVHDGDPVERT
jgi:uncharacterized protein YcbX